MRHGAADEQQNASNSTIPVGLPVELICDSLVREADSSRFPCEVHGDRCVKFALKWIGPDQIWIFDRIAALHVKDQQDGTLNKGKQLAAALVGANPYTVPSYWIDDETAEFGFDPAKQQVAGQLMRGMKVHAELLRKLVEGETRIRIARYVPATAIATPNVPAPATQVAQPNVSAPAPASAGPVPMGATPAPAPNRQPSTPLL